MKRIVAFLVAAGVAAGVGACASSGVSLSSTSYTGEDLAAAQYDNMYDFLKAHSRVRVGQTGASVPLAVRIQGQSSTGVSGGDNATGGLSMGTDTSERSLGGGGSDEGGSGAEGAPGSGQFTPAMLYIGDAEAGSPIPRLRQISPSDVESLELLDPGEASSRYGGDGRLAIVALTLQSGDDD